MMISCGREFASSISVRSVASVAGVSLGWRRKRNHSEWHVPHRPRTPPPPLLPLCYQVPESDRRAVLPMISRAAPLQNDRDLPLLLAAVPRRPDTFLPLPAPTPSFHHHSSPPLLKLRQDPGKMSFVSDSQSKRIGGEGGVHCGHCGDTRTVSCAYKSTRTLPTPPSQSLSLDRTTAPLASGTSRQEHKSTV